MNIPFFNYPDLFAQHSAELTDVFQKVASRGAFIMQNDLSDFENKLAKYTGIKYALGVANATDAMQLLLKAGGIGAGDEVLFCSHTMVATASAIKFTGATPVPVEAGVDHLMDVSSIESAITPITKAIMPTQLNGRVANMDAILAIADKYNLQVYEDSAQALGARYKGKSAGSFGVGGCISFYPAKVLGCFGDGGAVLTNDVEIYNTIKLMRDHGRGEDGNVSVWGYNSRLDNLQAAILNYFFDDYNAIVERRRTIADLYSTSLKDLNAVTLPPAVDSSEEHFDIYQNYEIEADRRDALKEYLANNGVGTLVQWGGKAVHEFKDLGFTQSLPFTEKIMRSSLMLPLNMTVTDDEVKYICDCVKDFYND
ncbi:MAG: DegT/DnrJ/EryC1/StrS family aminotransferase [Candidatus Thioglobus sp.]